mmetsp:Transcript_9529/g.28136  ORF Transcript_9529/g.28136 Transcript_9529/m.28136 type:complete len:227 (+) Transcript_9529:887-1567(+)
MSVQDTGRARLCCTMFSSTPIGSRTWFSATADDRSPLASSTKSLPEGSLTSPVRSPRHATAAARQALASAPPLSSCLDRMKPDSSGSSPYSFAMSASSLACGPRASMTPVCPPQAARCSSVIRCLQRWPSPAWNPRCSSSWTHSAQPSLAQCCRRGQSGGVWVRSTPERTRSSHREEARARRRSSPSRDSSRACSMASYFFFAFCCVSAVTNPTTKASSISSSAGY